MLHRNLATDKGLVNGSVGFVKDIVYDSDNDPSRFMMPKSIIVEFASYTGPPFFQGEGREKWIPLRPQKQFIDRIKKTFRRQFPICMAYAITGHKCSLSSDTTVIRAITKRAGVKASKFFMY